MNLYILFHKQKYIVIYKLTAKYIRYVYLIIVERARQKCTIELILPLYKDGLRTTKYVDNTIS